MRYTRVIIPCEQSNKTESSELLSSDEKREYLHRILSLAVPSEPLFHEHLAKIEYELSFGQVELGGGAYFLEGRPFLQPSFCNQKSDHVAARFYGRQTQFEQIWRIFSLQYKFDGRLPALVPCVVGSGGMGKTAFLSALSKQNREATVAFHHALNCCSSSFGSKFVGVLQEMRGIFVSFSGRTAPCPLEKVLDADQSLAVRLGFYLSGGYSRASKLCFPSFVGIFSRTPMTTLELLAVFEVCPVLIAVDDIWRVGDEKAAEIYKVISRAAQFFCGKIFFVVSSSFSRVLENAVWNKFAEGGKEEAAAAAVCESMWIINLPPLADDDVRSAHEYYRASYTADRGDGWNADPRLKNGSILYNEACGHPLLLKEFFQSFQDRPFPERYSYGASGLKLTKTWPMVGKTIRNGGAVKLACSLFFLLVRDAEHFIPDESRWAQLYDIVRDTGLIPVDDRGITLQRRLAPFMWGCFRMVRPPRALVSCIDNVNDAATKMIDADDSSFTARIFDEYCQNLLLLLFQLPSLAARMAHFDPSLPLIFWGPERVQPCHSMREIVSMSCLDADMVGVNQRGLKHIPFSDLGIDLCEAYVFTKIDSGPQDFAASLISQGLSGLLLGSQSLSWGLDYVAIHRSDQITAVEVRWGEEDGCWKVTPSIIARSINNLLARHEWCARALANRRLTYVMITNRFATSYVRSCDEFTQKIAAAINNVSDDDRKYLAKCITLISRDILEQISPLCVNRPQFTKKK